MFCEDYPCCGHTPLDPCDMGSAPQMAWYCDDCCRIHRGDCPWW